MFKKVLVATDILGTCDAAVSTAADIAKNNTATLYLLHVLESAYTGKYRHFVKHFETGEEIVTTEAYEKAVQEQLVKNCSNILNGLDNYEIRIRPGFPWEQILKWARKESVDLIVLGPHSGRAEARGVARISGTIGSTVEGVIMHEHCPVMIINNPVPENKLTFNKILICVDFSKSCKNALELAVKIGKKNRAKLFLFHMLAVPASLRYPQVALEKQRDALRDQLEAFSEKIPNEIERQYCVWEGILPHLEILKYAREKQVDLIAMGSHTKERGDKWYVGSAVEQVSSRSTCPVAVVTDPNVLLKIKD